MKNSSDSMAARLNILSTLSDMDASGLPEGDPEKTEISVNGTIRFDSRGDVFISYREDSEGGAIFSDIKISKSKVTVLRRGAIESTLVFEEGIIHRSVYSLPPYKMDMEIITGRIRKNIDDGNLQLTLNYQMKVGGSKRAAVFKITAAY